MKRLSETPARIRRLFRRDNKVPGGINHHVNHSSALKDVHKFDVYVPRGYEEKNSQRYPVLYLLHGYGDNAASWAKRGRVCAIAGKLIAAGQMAETIIVMPSCYGDPTILNRADYGLCSDEDLQRNTDVFIEVLLSEVAPRIEKEYPVLADRRSRAIAGVSMGGAQALAAGISRAEYFGWVGAFSAAEVPGGAKKYIHRGLETNFKPHRIWLACGSDEMLLPVNETLETELQANGYSTSLVIADKSGHNWKTWRRNLTEFLPLLFRHSLQTEDYISGRLG